MNTRRDIRFVIAARLECLSAIHVGGSGDDRDIDLAAAIDGAENLYLPGSGLAGVLSKAIGRQQEDGIWGYAGERDDDPGHASRVFIEDLPFCVVRDGRTVPLTRRDVIVRTRIAIDPFTGTAAPDLLFRQELVPRGSLLQLRMTVECRKDAEAEIMTFLSRLKGVLETELFVGAGKSAGLGRLSLSRTAADRIIISREDWSSAAGISALLRGTSADISDQVEATGTDEMLRMRAAWTARQSTFSRGSAGAHEVEIAPLFERDVTGRCCAVLPGSALKGAIRSQARRILATMSEGASTPFLDTVFGSPAEEGSDRAVSISPRHEGAWWRRGAGALIVQDCHGEMPADWQDDVAGAMHNAIDRWTGAPADGVLFDELDCSKFRWGDLRLDLDTARLPDRTAAKAALALIALVIEDLRRGRFVVGFGGNRGHGEMCVGETTLSGSLGGDPISGDSGLSMRPDELDRAFDGGIASAWRTLQERRFADVLEGYGQGHYD